MTALTPPAKDGREPLFNLPPLTFALLIGFTAIHLIRAVSLSANQTLVNFLAFMPAAFSHDPLGQSYTILGYGLLHFGWLHFFTNMTGLMAFGSGVERHFGKAWVMLLLWGGVAAGALGHWALEPQSLIPLGGASAGISALFGGLIPLLFHGRNFWAATAVFLLANVAVGLLGIPNEPGLAIAWQAHIAGFGFGLAAVYAKFRFIPHQENDDAIP